MRTPLENRWHTMIQRCTNPNAKSYSRYGGRGIAVCERWMSFENFLADMGYPPAPGMSIERKDNSIGYSPENCVWATPLEQARNTRQTRVLELNGQRKCAAEWAESLGISVSTLAERLDAGWPLVSALTLRSQRPTLKPVVYVSHNGESVSISEAARRTGLNRICITRRMNRGLTQETGLFAPPDARFSHQRLGDQ